MENKDEREFDEIELKNVVGGYQHIYRYEHPFQESEIYGSSQQSKLNELEEQLREIEETKTSRGRR